MHSIVDDHSRFAYSEILGDEKAATCAGFFARAVEAFAAAGINRFDAVMTDNHCSYVHSNALAAHLGGVRDAPDMGPARCRHVVLAESAGR